MVLGKQVPDKTLLKSVTQKLAQRVGGSGSKIVPTVSSGAVTLTGILSQEFLRRSITSSMSSISGVRRVIDNMTVVPPKKRV